MGILVWPFGADDPAVRPGRRSAAFQRRTFHFVPVELKSLYDLSDSKERTATSKNEDDRYYAGKN